MWYDTNLLEDLPASKPGSVHTENHATCFSRTFCSTTPSHDVTKQMVAIPICISVKISSLAVPFGFSKHGEGRSVTLRRNY
jgi:hypothetical protein